MKKIPLHWKIIIGMVLGICVGFLMSNFGQFGKQLVSNWIKPFGTIFINSLKLIAIPLILASLIKGISDLKDISKLSKMGGITITTYLITTVIAVSVGLAIVNIIKPGNTISEETRIELLNAYEDDADKKRAVAADKSTYTLVNVLLPIDKKTGGLFMFKLDMKGIACSKGSACQSGSDNGSHKLFLLLKILVKD